MDVGRGARHQATVHDEIFVEAADPRHRAGHGPRRPAGGHLGPHEGLEVGSVERARILGVRRREARQLTEVAGVAFDGIGSQTTLHGEVRQIGIHEVVARRLFGLAHGTVEL